MRGLQGDLEEFRRQMGLSRQSPRPPNKTKSSFFEGPAQRAGTIRERFFKVHVVAGKCIEL